MYLPTPPPPPSPPLPPPLQVEYVHVPTHVRTYCPIPTALSPAIYFSPINPSHLSPPPPPSPSSFSSSSSPDPRSTASTCLVSSCIALSCLVSSRPFVTPSRPLGHPPSPGTTNLRRTTDTACIHIVYLQIATSSHPSSLI